MMLIFKARRRKTIALTVANRHPSSSFLCSRLSWIGILSAALLIASPALAGTVSLDTSVTVNKRELDVELQIFVANRGDDTAYRVKPSARIGDVTFEFEPASIGPDKRQMFRAQQKLPAIAAMKPGEYPVPVTVSYHDAAGAQFYAPAYGLLRTANTVTTPTFTVQADAVNLRDRARLPVRVLTTERDMSVTITPHTTPAVNISPGIITAQLVAGQPVTVGFELRNQSALAGSVMPLLLFLESETKETHATLVREVPLTIELDASTVASETSAINRVRWIIGLGLAVLLLAGASTVWIYARRSHI